MTDYLHCLDAEANFLGIFDTTLAPELLYYAYIPISLVSLLIGILVYRNKSVFNLPNKLLFFFTVTYSLYLLNEIMQWTAVPAGIVHFSWQMIAIFYTILCFFIFYFVYAFINKTDLPISYKILLAILATPAIVFVPTSLNMELFDISYCESQTGILFTYVYSLMILTCVAIGFISIKSFFTTQRKVEVLLLGTGAVLMVMILTFADVLSEHTGDFEINLIGPIGMLGFIVVLSYLIVKFHAFNIKLAAAQALVVALIFVTFSELFFVDTLTNYILVSITLIFSILGGYYLVKSVKKEIAQREQLEVLTEQLANANERLKILDKMKSEFVSIASHQLRSPLTSIRGYASMLAEGSYGKLSDAAQEAASNIAESSKYMAMSIEDYLNVSRIEAGNMKYEMSDFGLKEIAEKVVDEMRPTAMKKGLVMVFRSDCTGMGTIHADIGKTRQIIMNLVDNSMKYTPKGTITVVAHDDVKKKKMYVTIQDTGIGMGKETLEEVFDKFVRAKNANSVNVTGTGLGLFVAKKMVTEMKGRVWAESEGEGMGSTFNVEFPLVGGK